jgi:hypothetical protein
MFKGLSFKDLHDNEVLALVLVYIVDGADVGVIQRRSSASFPLKTLDSQMVFGDLFRQEFHGDKAAQLKVFGLVNHTHTAPTKLLDNSIVGNDFANHGKETAIARSYY